MKFFSNYYSKYSAFSLIEVLVVVSIIIILSVIVLTNYELGGYQFAVQRSANKLSQDLRKAEEMAMSAKVFNGSVPPGGYGIYLEHGGTGTSTYILFADLNGNSSYETTELVEILKIEDSVSIAGLCQTPDPPCVCESFLNITFTPPDPIIRFNGAIATTCSAEAYLKSNKTNDEIYLYLRPTGLIEIKEIED